MLFSLSNCLSVHPFLGPTFKKMELLSYTTYHYNHPPRLGLGSRGLVQCRCLNMIKSHKKTREATSQTKLVKFQFLLQVSTQIHFLNCSKFWILAILSMRKFLEMLPILQFQYHLSKNSYSNFKRTLVTCQYSSIYPWVIQKFPPERFYSKIVF